LGGDVVVVYVYVDVIDKDQVDVLFWIVKDIYGFVDIVFNNVGISLLEDDLILDIDLDAWCKV